MDIAAADGSTLIAVENTLAAIEAASRAAHASTTRTPATTSAAPPSASASAAPAAGPLASKYRYTVCDTCHRLGHTAQHCTQLAPQQQRQQHKKSQPAAHKHDPSTPTAQAPPTPPASLPATTAQPQSDSTADDEDAAAMLEQLSVSSPAAVAVTGVGSAAAGRAAGSPYGEHRLPLCFVCGQRHDFGQCRKGKR